MMGASKHFKITGAAFAALVVSVATSSCGWLPKKVTEKDCTDWSDKFAKLTKDAVNDNMKKCGKKAVKAGADKGKEKDEEKTLDSALGDTIDKQAKELTKGCVSQVGKSYIAKDADCYMKASKMGEWASCNFQTPFFTDFSDMAKDFDKKFQASCDEGIDTAKSKGDDKGDKGKKKGDDDDDDDKK